MKLAQEIGGSKAAKELGIPEGTICGWLHAVKTGYLDAGAGTHTPSSALSLAQEVAALRKQVKAQEKEIRQLREINEFLEEVSCAGPCHGGQYESDTV